jgi:hypothetical protein
MNGYTIGSKWTDEDWGRAIEVVKAHRTTNNNTKLKLLVQHALGRHIGNNKLSEVIGRAGLLGAAYKVPRAKRTDRMASGFAHRVDSKPRLDPERLRTDHAQPKPSREFPNVPARLCAGVALAERRAIQRRQIQAN